MSGLTFKLNAAPEERLDLSALTPSRLSGMAAGEIPRLVIGTTKRKLTVGDVFTISGIAGDTVTIVGGSGRLDFIGAALDSGTVIVEGDVGICAGHGMRGGRLEIKGDAGPWLAAALSGGEVFLKGSAGGNVGGMRPGDPYGMSGGVVVIDGDAGDRIGDRMRRGTIIVRRRCGAFAGSRMMGGTVWSEQGFGPSPGVLMRRGSLIGLSVEQMLPTFADTGKHDLVILRVLSRHFAKVLGQRAPRLPGGSVRKFAGDLASIGKGEILITA